MDGILCGQLGVLSAMDLCHTACDDAIINMREIETGEIVQ